MIEGVPKNPVGDTDAGAEREDRTKPCCFNFAPGRWCSLADRHDGDHDGPSRREPPAPELPKGKIR